MAAVVPRSGADVLTHDAGIFVLKDVAMIHEWVFSRRRLIKDDEKLGRILDERDVFPTGQVGGRRLSLE